jgi:hypothetical protein
MSITLDQVRAEALFACDLQPSEHPPPGRVRREVTGMLRRYGSVWCASRMAEEFGDHPEAAACRMAWALRVVHDCFDPDAPRTRTLCRPLLRATGSRPLPAGRAGRCRYPTGRYRHAVGRGDGWC